jgi:hypothetical protein
VTTLERINGEALAVPGLRIWGNWSGPVFAIIAQDGRGAAEVWWDSVSDDGGVELHHATQPADTVPYDEVTHCTILDGRCWADRSLVAWPAQFVPLVRAGDSAGVLRRLAGWHDAHFGGHS